MSEQESILKMVSEGVLRPEEAAKLIAILNAPPAPEPPKTATITEAKPTAEPPKAEAKEEEKKKAPTMEVQMQRPDGSYYTVTVPTGLVPAVLKIAGVSIKESVKQNSQEAWGGFKTMVKRKATEVKDNVKDKVTGKGTPTESPVVTTATATPPTTAPKKDHSGERQIILRMVQNGRLSAEEASRLIEAMETR